jgi:exoribonuclease R
MEIRTNVKRGKGKINKCLTLKDAYKKYVEENKKKNTKFESWKVFKELCNDYNKESLRRVIEESETVKLPYRLGNLTVIKRKLNLGKLSKNKWIIDYQKSKELGFIVYFDNDFKYYIKWDKFKAVFKWKSVYYFKACRTAKRTLASAIKQGKDYFLK